MTDGPQYQAPPPAPGMPPVQPPPGPQGPAPATNRLVAVLLAVCGILALFVVGGVYLAREVAHRFSVQKDGDKVTLQTPVGDLRVDKSGKANPGLPVYPGAEADPDDKGVKVDVPLDAGFQVVVAKYLTDDERETVDEWYKKHLPSDFERHTGEEEMIHKNRPGMTEIKKDEIAYVAEQGDHVRVIVLAKHDDGTEIRLVRVGPAEAQ